jgi:hypothetical protein
MADASDFPDFNIEFATSDHCLCSIPELAFLVWPLASRFCHGISHSPLGVDVFPTNWVSLPFSSPLPSSSLKLFLAYSGYLSILFVLGWGKRTEVIGIDAISYKTGMVKLMPIWDWANHQLINEPVSIALSLCHRPSGLGIASMTKAPQP